MLDTTANAEVQTLLDTFGAALERGDIAAATACFQDDCYWRDLVTFTWNIHTSEGKHQIAAMLHAQLATTNPSGYYGCNNYPADGPSPQAKPQARMAA